MKGDGRGEKQTSPVFSMKTLKQIPDTLTIPSPMPTPRARGIYATGSMGSNVKTRLSHIDTEKIDEAAGLLGMTRADFIRWCAVKTAEKILES
jgi:hypothetical protein